MTRTLVHIDGHRKFWSVSADGTVAVTRWGRIGTKGQAKAFNFSYAEAARIFARNKINEKLRKGYIELAA